MREVRLAAGLRHPNILPVYQSGAVDGTPFYVMPYVEGESLATHIRRNGRSSVRDAVAVFRDVARAFIGC